MRERVIYCLQGDRQTNGHTQTERERERESESERDREKERERFTCISASTV